MNLGSFSEAQGVFDPELLKGVFLDLAESPEGVAIQIYSALIAALILQAFTGKRAMELIQIYLMVTRISTKSSNCWDRQNSQVRAWG